MPTFIYNPSDNQTKLLIKSKLGKCGVKVRFKTSNLKKPLKVAASMKPAIKTSLDPRIKCIGSRFYDFFGDDGTFI